MNLPETIAERIEPVLQRWRALDPRWQRVLAQWGVVVAAGLALLVLFALSREGEKLERSLAALAVTQARFDADAKEARALLALPVSASATSAADVAALQALAGEGIVVTVTGDAFRLMGASIAYARWWNLLAELDRRHGLTMVALELAPKQDVKENISFDMTVSRRKTP
jgi:type II secretory pathway component PulM